MAVAEMSPETLAALQAQSGAAAPPQASQAPPTEQNIPTKDAVVPDLDIDLKLDEIDDTVDETPEEKPEVKPAQKETEEPKTSPKAEDTKAEDTDEADAEDKEALTSLEAAGLTEKDVIDRITKDGGITDEYVAELKEKIDPDVVDKHVARIREGITAAQEGMKAKRDAENARITEMNDYIFKAFGGEDKFKTVGDTLMSKLDKAEVDLLNAKLASGNKALVNEGLTQMADKYKQLRGRGGKLMTGDAGTGPEAKQAVHTTKEEYQSLIKTDKYKTDPAYAAEVDANRMKTMQEDRQRYGKGTYYGFHPTKGRYKL